MRDCAGAAAAHPGGEREEKWRQARRVDGHEQRDEGGEGLVEHRRRIR